MGMVKLNANRQNAMKTPVGSRSSAPAARSPLQPLSPNPRCDAVSSTASNQNNLSRDSTKDTRKADNIKREMEKNEVFVESIEKQLGLMKINNAKREVDQKEPRAEFNIQTLSKALETCTLKESLAGRESNLKNKLVTNIPRDEDDVGKHRTSPKADSATDKEPQASDAIKDGDKANDDAQKSREIESNLCSRGPTRNEHYPERPSPYMNKNIICSRNHHSGGGVVSVCDLPVPSQGMLNQATNRDFFLNISSEEELPVLSQEVLNDPRVWNAVNILQTSQMPQTTQTFQSFNIGDTATYREIHNNEEAYNSEQLLNNIDEGYPDSPDSALVPPGSVSPANVVDFDLPGDLEERITAEIDSSGNRLEVLLPKRGPLSVDSGSASPPPFGAPSPQPDLLNTVPNIQPDLVQNNFSHMSPEHVTLSNDYLGSPRARPLSIPECPSFSQPATVYPTSVHHNVPVQCQSASAAQYIQPVSKPQSPTPPQTKSPPKLLPRLPEKKPAQKKLHDKLDKDRKNTSWAKVNSVSVKDLTSSDRDGDTQLMIILSNKCENFLEVVYAMVERMRKIPGALATENKKGFTALYVASVLLNEEPLVAAYIAEALTEQGMNVAHLEYEGLPLIECVRKRGTSHQQILNELLSLKDENNQFVFASQTNSV